MNKNGPIIVVEDSQDGRSLLSEVVMKLGYSNQILSFFSGEEALDYLQNATITPFLILSDTRMPRLDGFALRDKIQMGAACRQGVFRTCFS